jgi:hypothetical protein
MFREAIKTYVFLIRVIFKLVDCLVLIPVSLYCALSSCMYIAATLRLPLGYSQMILN